MRSRRRKYQIEPYKILEMFIFTFHLSCKLLAAMFEVLKNLLASNLVVRNIKFIF